MCASGRVCACVSTRVNEGGRANIYLVTVEKRRVKSDERKTGRKAKRERREQREIQTNILREKRRM